MKTETEIRAKIESLLDSDDEQLTPHEVLQWALEPSPVKHVGAGANRCEHLYDGWLNREKIFADGWTKTNHPPSFLNGGVGTLEWLLLSKPAKYPVCPGEQRIKGHLTQEQATAAASAIQWLGTNCGWCWLEECIRSCGFDIVKRRGAK